MGIRMSGIISGLDTESVIKELMKAQSTKKTKIENKITKHEWKTEKWKELNTKILNLYTGTLSKARLQGSYMTKKAVSSDETKVTASATASAVNGTHRVQVLNTASAQYVTGAKLGTVKNTQGEDVAVSGSTKLTQLGFVTDRDGNKETMINISSGDKMISLAVNDDTTVNDFLAACKGAGLNASYDTTQKRFFISAAESGVENSFTITTSTEAAGLSKNAVRDALGYDNLSAADKGKINVALNAYKNATTQEAKDAAMETLNSYVVAGTKSNLVQGWVDAFEKQAGPSDANYYTADLKEKMEAAAEEAEEKYMKSLSDGESVDPEARKKAIDSAVLKVANEYASELEKKYESGEEAGNPFFDAKASLGGLVENYAKDNTIDNTPLETNALSHLGLQEIADGTATASKDGFSLVGASDAVILYNGAELTSSTSSISVNGITINANAKTEGEVSITVSNDNSAVYDMVKEFIKEYNEVLGLMNDSYNASSARDYEVLTDEEREAMTDEQIEKWENKIKDSLLRRDSTLGSLLSSMKSAMQTSITYNGKSYSLSSFGICTTDYTEYGKLHIYGDADDSTVSGKEDKLMAAIESDPDAVMNVLSGIAGKLYDSLQVQMKSTTLSSSMTLYNDKQMSKDLTSYQEELKKMETYLKDMEDRYYKQFTAMETAMAKLNSQSNSLASLLGTSTQQ